MGSATTIFIASLLWIVLVIFHDNARQSLRHTAESLQRQIEVTKAEHRKELEQHDDAFVALREKLRECRKKLAREGGSKGGPTLRTDPLDRTENIYEYNAFEETRRACHAEALRTLLDFINAEVLKAADGFTGDEFVMCGDFYTIAPVSAKLKKRELDDILLHAKKALMRNYAVSRCEVSGTTFTIELSTVAPPHLHSADDGTDTTRETETVNETGESGDITEHIREQDAESSKHTSTETQALDVWLGIAVAFVLAGYMCYIFVNIENGGDF